MLQFVSFCLEMSKLTPQITIYNSLLEYNAVSLPGFLSQFCMYIYIYIYVHIHACIDRYELISGEWTHIGWFTLLHSTPLFLPGCWCLTSWQFVPFLWSKVNAHLLSFHRFTNKSTFKTSCTFYTIVFFLAMLLRLTENNKWHKLKVI